MEKYEMKYMFDWGSGTCVWSVNDEAIHDYDYAVSIEDLPISKELKEYLNCLVCRHDEALNWNDPAGDLLWDQKEIESFKQEAKLGYERLCQELSSIGYNIELAQVKIS